MTNKAVSSTMPAELRKLLDAAQAVPMSNHDKEEQRRSFAYGNAKIENDRVTKEMVGREAKALKR